jgi:hypothetical protein
MKGGRLIATLMLGTSLVTAVAAAQPEASSDCVPDISVSVGAPQTFATHSQLAGYGFTFGPSDGNFGAIARGDGTYSFYGTGGAASQCTTTNTGCEGAFTFSGTLDAVTGANTATALFGPGAGPGWVFDRNYAGGGQLIHFNDGNGNHGRFMSFHGEYQWPNNNPGNHNHLCSVGGSTTSFVACFYSGLGLAVSLDDGQTFNVVGQIMQPTQPLSLFVGSGTIMPVGYGSMVVADRRGQRVENPPLVLGEAYFYLMFSDQLPAGTANVGVCGNAGVNCMGIARAPYLDLIHAALSGDPHEVAKAFHKYDPGASGAWKQPATGNEADLSGTAGAFAPLWTDEGANQGSIIYDRRKDVYLATYQFGGIHVRASKDLIHWTDTLAVIPNPTSPAATYFYPTLIGETGAPDVAEGAPRLYFTSFGTFPDWTGSTFEYIELTLSGSGRLPKGCPGADR